MSAIASGIFEWTKGLISPKIDITESFKNIKNDLLMLLDSCIKDTVKFV